MQNKLLKNYLADVLLAIDEIKVFADDFLFEDYKVLKNKWAVERGLSNIGEALYKANKLEPGLAITNLNRIIATRHIIIHDYDVVDADRLYIIVRKHLPLLKEETEQY
ncbi:MAG: DUF86 domain-containing protein [Bacteroidetes bacterium]|nr:DUF86 domain-containing protein [Bacteroidota bacterium]